jgi:hypothetical protein
MIEILQWGDSPIERLKNFVLEHRGQHSGAHPLLPEFHDEPVVQEFAQFAKDSFEHLNLNAIRWRYWVSVVDPTKDEWAPGFPHVHGWDGWTLIHYLQPAEYGGELFTRDSKEDKWTIIEPQQGMAVIVDGKNEHGVKGPLSSPRITIIATGFPT